MEQEDEQRQTGREVCSKSAEDQTPDFTVEPFTRLISSSTRGSRRELIVRTRSDPCIFNVSIVSFVFILEKIKANTLDIFALSLFV